MMQDNNWYGHRSILANYCGINDKPSFSSIQHGWSAYYNNGNFGKKKNTFIPYLCWSKFTEENCKNKGFKKVHAIGSPFLYLCEILKKEKQNKPEGTIVFPPHNTPTIKDSITSHEKIIKYTEQFCEAPYTVCFFYSDFIKINIDVYKKKNWRTITCGSRGDEKMLYKLYKEIINHDTIVSSELSTVIFYGMYLKKKIKLLKKIDDQIISDRSADRIENINKEYDEQLRDQLLFEDNLVKKYPQIVNSFLKNEDGYELSKIQLGFDSMKNISDLKKLLGWSSNIKIFLSRLISLYFDFRYGKKVSTGENE